MTQATMNGKSKKYTYNPLASYWGRTFHELTLRLEVTPRRAWLVFPCATAREAYSVSALLRYHRDRAEMKGQVEIKLHKLEDGSGYVVGARRSPSWKLAKEAATS